MAGVSHKLSDLRNRLDQAILAAEGLGGFDDHVVSAFPHLFNDVLCLRRARRGVRARLSDLSVGGILQALDALEAREVAILFTAYWQDDGGEG